MTAMVSAQRYTPSHTVHNARRYRYYVAHRADPLQDARPVRIPAQDLETLVVQRLLLPATAQKLPRMASWMQTLSYVPKLRERYAVCEVTQVIDANGQTLPTAYAKGPPMNAPTTWFAKRSVIATLMLFPTYALAQQDPQPPAHAEVKIKPIGSNNVNGTLILEQTGQSVAVKGTLNALTPGKHGLHIHEGRSCSSRGGHFSPVNAPHGAPDSGEANHHLGDLGNVVAGQDGTANYSGVAKNVTLTGANSIDGRVLVVHQGEDDLVSQPSGKSGEQIGCGVIKVMPQ